MVSEKVGSMVEDRIFGYKPMAMVTSNKDVNVADVRKASQYFFFTINLLSFKSKSKVTTGIKNKTGIALNSSAACGTYTNVANESIT